MNRIDQTFADLQATGRKALVIYLTAGDPDAEAVEAFHLLCRLEGIIPALESSHALAAALKAAKDMRPDQQIVVCLSGRGDKDIDHVNAWTAAHGGGATA